MKVRRLSKIILVSFLICLIVACQQGKNDSVESSVQIQVWYGENQTFGKTGIPQKWINILGNINAKKGIKHVFYRLNDGDSVSITLGSDLHRLAGEGDFNIDIAFEDCNPGKNQIQVFATDSTGKRVSKTTGFIVFKDKKWPLPYTIKWSEVENIQDVVQIVDGYWVISEYGLHNLDIYYDRMVAFGDSTWKNYEVTTTVTFHDFTPPAQGPPTYNVSHAAIATRWPGHSEDNLQPHRQWYPLGATSEFRLTNELDSCRWRIFDGPKPNSENFYIEQPVEDFRKTELNKTYGMKHRVESIGDENTKYSVKLWPVEQEEPAEWDFSGIENNENVRYGSAALIAHNTSVTFGDVFVKPIEK
jgi:hypothetical protein